MSSSRSLRLTPDILDLYDDNSSVGSRRSWKSVSSAKSLGSLRSLGSLGSLLPRRNSDVMSVELYPNKKRNYTRRTPSKRGYTRGPYKLTGKYSTKKNKTSFGRKRKSHRSNRKSLRK
jgi:hypothetical protein